MTNRAQLQAPPKVNMRWNEQMNMRNLSQAIGLACAITSLAPHCMARPVAICIPLESIPPLVFPDRDGQVQWLVRKAVEIQGDTVKFVPFPWEHCLDALRKGGYDAALPVALNAEFIPDIAYPMKDGKLDLARGFDPVSVVVVRRVGSAVNWDGRHFTNLATHVVLSMGAVIIKKKLMALHAAYDTGSHDDVLTFRKLLVGRADIALMGRAAADEVIKQDEFSGKLEILPTPFMTIPIFVAFNRSYYEKSTPYVEGIWNEIKRLRASPEWKKIGPALNH